MREDDKKIAEWLFYDGKFEARHSMSNMENTKFIVCSKCFGKLVKKIYKMEAAKKRGR